MTLMDLPKDRHRCVCVWQRQQINNGRTRTVRRPETYVTISNLQCLCLSNEITVFFFSFGQLWYFFNFREWMAALAPFPVGHRSHALSCLDNRLWKIVPGSCRWTQISQNEQRFNLRLHQFLMWILFGAYEMRGLRTEKPRQTYQNFHYSTQEWARATQLFINRCINFKENVVSNHKHRIRVDENSGWSKMASFAFVYAINHAYNLRSSICASRLGYERNTKFRKKAQCARLWICVVCFEANASTVVVRVSERL